MNSARGGEAGTTGREPEPQPLRPPAGARAHLIALAGYLLLALVVTYPAVAHFATAVPGDLIADRDQNLWNLWWARQAVAQGANPFHTTFLYYPYGVDLYYHTLALPLGLLGLLPQLAFGLPAAYNTLLLAAFTLSGYGAFRLALLYTRRPFAAFVGGLIFAFTPYTLDALKGQLEVLSVQWMPLYAEAWLRAWGGARSSWRWSALAGMYFALAAYTNLYYAVYLALFSVGIVVYVLASRRSPAANESPALRLSRPNRGLAASAVAGAIALALLAPLAWGLASDRSNARLEVQADPAHRLAHSADLLSFVAPPHDHLLLGNGSERPGVEEPPIHDYLALGYAALALALLGVWVGVRDRATTGPALLWAGVGAAALLLALGPQLQVGRTLTGIPMPFRLLEGLPGFDAIAKPERFVVLARLCMVAPGAWGVGWLTVRVAKRGPVQRTVLQAGLLALLLLELPIHPRYEAPLRTPAPLQALARQPAAGLMELPFATQQNETVGERMLAQTTHAHPIMAGYLSRNYNSPVIDSCSPFWGFISPRDVPREGAEIASPLVVDRPLDVLNFYNIGYVALYTHYSGPGSALLDAGEAGAYRSIIAQVTNGRPIAEDGEAQVYRVERGGEEAWPSFHLGAGWNREETVGGNPFRWMKGGEAALCVFAPRTTVASLNMEGTAFGQDRAVSLSADGRQIFTGTLLSGGRFAPVSTGPVEWQAGITEVTIAASGQAVTPRSLDPAVQDDRSLSAGFMAARLESARIK